MSDFVNTVDIYGDNALTDMIITRSITEYNDNAINKIGDHAFYGCAGLTSVRIPAATLIDRYAFVNCSKLPIIDLHSATKIDNYAFSYCSALKACVVRTPTMCNISGIAFQGSLIESGSGYIYVPRVLVDSYKEASGLQYYVNQIRALEDYTVDGTITGALDESKI